MKQNLKNYRKGASKMSEKWIRIRGWLIGVSCCALILGLIMLIWSHVSAMALCWILGFLSVGVGIHEITRYFQLGFAGLFFRLDLVLGICDILIGIILVFISCANFSSNQQGQRKNRPAFLPVCRCQLPLHFLRRRMGNCKANSKIAAPALIAPLKQMGQVFFVNPITII